MHRHFVLHQHMDLAFYQLTSVLIQQMACLLIHTPDEIEAAPRLEIFREKMGLHWPTIDQEACVE
jgi:hypothetical protein